MVLILMPAAQDMSCLDLFAGQQSVSLGFSWKLSQLWITSIRPDLIHNLESMGPVGVPENQFLKLIITIFGHPHFETNPHYDLESEVEKE